MYYGRTRTQLLTMAQGTLASRPGVLNAITSRRRFVWPHAVVESPPPVACARVLRVRQSANPVGMTTER